MKHALKLAGRGLEAVEFFVFACAAIGLVAFGPVIWVLRLFAAHHFLSATLVGIGWLGSVIAVVVEVRRRAVTVVSFGLLLAWLVTLVWVFQFGV